MIDTKEQKYINISSKYFKDNGIVIDVGAFFGEWTFQIMNVSPNNSFFLFEPNIENFNILVKRFENYKNVTLINSGVGDSIYSAEYFNLKNKDNGIRSMSGFVKREIYNKYEVEKIIIDILNLDSINFVEDINFLKIDVEGFELDVLKGSNNLLSKNKIKFIQFEYGGTFLDKGISLNDIILYLKSFGYNTYNFKNETIYEVVNFKDDYQYDNLLSTYIEII
jgi:FkbM family methyltransferase